MKTITLKLPDILERRLSTFARKYGLSKSEIVRRALKDYLSGDMVNNSGSFLDLAKDLAGSVEGPPDLSTNRAHFEGYGN